MIMTSQLYLPRYTSQLYLDIHSKLPPTYGKPMKPFNRSDVPDYELQLSCSCQDCDTSCPALYEYPSDTGRLQIGNIDLFGVISLILFLVIFCFILLARFDIPAAIKYGSYDVAYIQYDISCKGFYCQNRSHKDVRKPEVKSIEPEVLRLDPASPSKFQKVFYNWTNFVQNHPFWIIFISISFILFMMSGLIFIDFTTDPIKLWTSSESRSYKEYVKYNKYFGPFYRTQQIIASLKPEYDSLPGRDD